MFDVMETKLQFLWQISSDYTVKLTKFGWRCTALSSPPAGFVSIFNRDLFPVYKDLSGKNVSSVTAWLQRIGLYKDPTGVRSITVGNARPFPAFNLQGQQVPEGLSAGKAPERNQY